MKIELSKAFLAVGLPCLFLLSQINDVHGVQATSFSSPTSGRRYRKLKALTIATDTPTTSCRQDSQNPNEAWFLLTKSNLHI